MKEKEKNKKLEEEEEGRTKVEMINKDIINNK
jgi:hypothetical protein